MARYSPVSVSQYSNSKIRGYAARSSLVLLRCLCELVFNNVDAGMVKIPRRVFPVL